LSLLQRYEKETFFALVSKIIRIFVKISDMKTKSTYRFTSLKEPSLTELSMIMKEVAVEAREKARKAEQQFFRNISKQIKAEFN
jgi:hypothetical protein